MTKVKIDAYGRVHEPKHIPINEIRRRLAMMKKPSFWDYDMEARDAIVQNFLGKPIPEHLKRVEPMYLHAPLAKNIEVELARHRAWLLQQKKESDEPEIN